MDKKPMSNFVNPRIKFNKPTKVGTAAMFAAAADDAAVSVTFDGSTNIVSIVASDESVTVSKNKATIGFDLAVNNLPSGTSVQIAGIEFSKPNEPAGKYDPTDVFEAASTITDGNGAPHTVYGQWEEGRGELQVVDDDDVVAGAAEQDYGYRVWVKVTPKSGSPSYFSSPDPEVKNQPTGG